MNLVIHCAVCTGPVDEKRVRRGCITCCPEHQKVYKKHRHQIRDEKKLCPACKRARRAKRPQVSPEPRLELQ